MALFFFSNAATSLLGTASIEMYKLLRKPCFQYRKILVGARENRFFSLPKKTIAFHSDRCYF
jgi:hypothetical protein